MIRKSLNINSINPNILKAEYAVRGELAILADKYSHFQEIISCNIGNPQLLGQSPFTYYRQILSGLEYPNPNLPPDVQLQINHIKNKCPTIGAYSNSKGLEFIRSSIAEFIEQRDGFPSDKDQIFLTNGASEAISRCLNLLIRNKNDGIMIPVPQYPLYKAIITANDGTAIPYYLVEETSKKRWIIEMEELERAFKEACENGIEIRALCIINPGNPTGNLIRLEQLQEIIKFCLEKQIVLFSDEVYQENIYIDEPFFSAKKAYFLLFEKEEEGGKREWKRENLELFSFHSVSKGLLGECGRRGGYLECFGIDPEVVNQLYKLASIELCSNIQGQIMCYLMVNPPKEGDYSFPLFQKEKKEKYDSLKRKSEMLCNALNEMEGIDCIGAEGAMYLFPKITFSDSFKKEIEKRRKEKDGERENGIDRNNENKHQLLDTIYAIELLKNTGITVVPGSGFEQREGTWHIRTTFLPDEKNFPAILNKWKNFHSKFINAFK